jgi:hypothetical protein
MHALVFLILWQSVVCALVFCYTCSIGIYVTYMCIRLADPDTRTCIFPSQIQVSGSKGQKALDPGSRIRNMHEMTKN